MTKPTKSGYFRLQELARGGMGEIELALKADGQFRRLYAIKRLHESLREDPTFRAMFLDEARLSGLIRHTHVVSVLDVGEDARGPFLVMDYIEGVSITELLGRLRKRKELLPIQVALRIAADAARGLHAAHDLKNPDGVLLNLVHRDVSPSNILIGYDGTVRVTDFGVAKAIGRATQTEGGLLKGKFGYMSPEQLRFGEIDRRADLFALGIVLVELLTGERLYGSESPVSAPLRILEEDPPDPGERRSDLPPDLVALIFELLAKDPALRPPTAHVVAERLDALRVALESEMGVIHLAQYLAERFAEDRKAQEESLRESLARFEAANGSESKPSRPVSRHWLGIGLVLVLVSTFAFTATTWVQHGMSEAPPTETSLEPIADRPITTETPSEPDIVPTETIEDDIAQPMAAPPTTQEISRDTPRLPRDRRSPGVHRRVGSASAPSESSSTRPTPSRNESATSGPRSVPLWDWGAHSQE